MERDVFLTQMESTAKYLSRRYSRPTHPYLGAEDLFQEAMLTLFQVWERLHEQKPEDELRKMGRAAVFYRIRDVRKQAGAYGEQWAQCRSLDDPLFEESPGVPMLFESIVPDVRSLNWDFLAKVTELCFRLEGCQQQVLEEVIAPSDSTLRAFRRMEKNRRSTRGTGWKGYHRSRIIAQTLEVPYPEVHRAMGAIRRRVREVFFNHDSGETNMMTPTEKGFNPDDIEIGLPQIGGPEKPPAAPVTEKKTTQKKGSNHSAKTTAKPKDGKKAPASAKTAPKGKPMPPAKGTKPKDEKKPAPKVEAKAKEPVKEGDLKRLPTGTSIVYLGGSRAKGITTGMKGTITAQFGSGTVRYGVRFGSGKEAKATVLAAKYVKKA